MSVYYIHDNGVSVGPFERDILLKFVASGRLNAASAVRREDGAWATLADFPELHRTAPAREAGEPLPFAAILGENDGRLRFACPNCSLHYEGEGYRGRRLTCGSCGTVFQVPDEPVLPAGRFDAELADEIPDGELTCPHCGKSFPADRMLYISCHPALLGDPVAGDM